jgi:hypothetical protein
MQRLWEAPKARMDNLVELVWNEFGFSVSPASRGSDAVKLCLDKETFTLNDILKTEVGCARRCESECSRCLQCSVLITSTRYRGRTETA